MKNEAQKQFVAALNFLLKKEGRGSQARLARAIGIDSGYLNNIVKGRTPGSQEKKEKIASYFNLRYESMLSLGRWILFGFPGEIFESISSEARKLSERLKDPKLCFNFALYFLIHKRSEVIDELCAKCDINREVFDNLLAGTLVDFSPEKKEQIASRFNLDYEKMVALGYQLLTAEHPGKLVISNEDDSDLIIDEDLLADLLVDGGEDLVICKYRESDLPTLKEQHPIYEFSPRDKKDKNMMLIAEWISQQEDPAEYWTLLKMFLRREEPEFKEWLKKRTTGDNQGRFPENKSAVGE